MKIKILTILFYLIPIVYSSAQTNTFPSDGNVGIGTNSPNSWFTGKTLEVYDNRPILKLNSSNSHSTILFTNSQINSSTHYGEFHFNHAYNSTNPSLSILSFNSYPTQAILNLRSDGNVGIGTSSPRMPLDIKGKVSIGTQSPTTGSGLEIYHYSNNTSYINSYDRNNRIYLPLSISASEFTFNNGGAKMYIDSDGNVGIGTTSLTNKLEVAGTIRAEEIKVEAAPWADFVFEKDYNLRPLQEVNTYIQQNGHLPEIPTAKEVEENGISLGEMNAKLLQKIEELTLYTIDQEKKISDLMEINERLSEQNKRIDELEKLIKNQ